MKTLAILIFVLFFFPQLFLAQVEVVHDVNLNNPEIFVHRSGRLSYEQIEGSPYYSRDFLPSKVYMSNKKILELKTRYDKYVDEVEIYDSKQIRYLVKGGIDSLVAGNEKFICTAFQSNSKTINSWFIVLYEAKYSLLLRKKVEFRDQDKAIPYAEAKPARFLEKPDAYFLKIQTNAAQEIGSRKEFAKAFPELYKASESFIKLEKINFSKQADVLKLVGFLNK